MLSLSYLQAGLIVLCVFLLILTFGMLRHRYNNWTIKGVFPGIALGFIFALVIEAALLVGGRTVITEVLGWKDAPKPISNALEVSRSRFVDVLGVTVPESKADQKPTAGAIADSYSNLSKSEQDSLKTLICPAE